MYFRFTLSWILVIFYFSVHSQPCKPTIKVSINSVIQPLDQQELVILNNWQEYLNSIDTIHYSPSPFWSEEDRKNQRVPDIDIIGIASETNMFRKYTPTLLSMQLKDSIYFIKTAFTDSLRNLHSIYNVLAKKDADGKYYFYGYKTFYTRSWTHEKINTIEFIYDNKTTDFNRNNARRSVSFSDSIASLLGTNTIQFKFYVFKNTEDRSRAAGYDYTYLMYNSIQESSMADISNQSIYSGKGLEYDPHEITHVYLNSVYWKTLSSFFDEGIATFLGGNVEKSSKMELVNMQDFLLENPDINLSNVVSMRKLTKNKTNIRYAISAFLCKKVYEKHGFEGVKELCKSGTADKDVYYAIETLLHVNQVNLNHYLRHEISKAR